jgi:hypothetical protein
MDREQALESRLSTLPDSMLRVNCMHCRKRLTLMSPKALAAHYGDITFRQAVQRLRCAQCGRKPSTVFLHERLVDAELAGWEVRLR